MHLLHPFSFVASDPKPITNTGKLQKWERVLEFRFVDKAHAGAHATAYPLIVVVRYFGESADFFSIFR